MKRLFASLVALSILSMLSGCVAPPPPGFHYAAGEHTKLYPDNACETAYVNTSAVLNLMNQSVGKSHGVPGRVKAIVGSSTASYLDAFPVPTSVAYRSSCEATLLLTNGKKVKGAYFLGKPPGREDFLVFWVPWSDYLKDIRQSERKRRLKMEKMLYQQQIVDTCNLEYQIGSSAQIFRNRGWSEAQTENNLINQYAYGPSGQVYRDSNAIVRLVKQITTSIYLPENRRKALDVPNYLTSDFVPLCVRRADQDSQ